MSNNIKICPVCRQTFSPESTFCKSCGGLLQNYDTNGNSQIDYGMNNYAGNIWDYSGFNQYGNYSESRRKNVIVVLVALLSVLIVAAAAFIIIFFVDRDDNKSDKTNKKDDFLSVESSISVTTDFITQPQTTVTATVTLPPKTETVISVLTSVETVVVKQNKVFIAVPDACTWEQAELKCEEMGGHLAYITCDEDFNAIKSQLSGTDLRYLWVGGVSKIMPDGSVSVSWINGEGTDYIYDNNLWFGSEPSGVDINNPSRPEEPYLMLWQIEGKWSFNDNSKRALECYKSYRIGYICEIDS